MFGSALRAIACIAGLAAVAAAGTARAEVEVDLALVLAVDISYSMDPEEQVLQREGFVEAFRSPQVQDAIRRGAVGRIAVTYFEWAGANDQRVVMPWAIIDGPGAATAFASELGAKPTRRAARTSVSGAIDFAVALVDKGDFAAARLVIDVSGDGPNNQGRPVTAARDAAIARGITINGLPIMLKSAGYFDIPDLDLYYRDCVIGGPGAFLVPARSREQFRDAIRTKIIREVASAPVAPDGERVVPAAGDGPAGNCFAGEAQWRDRMGN